ncbi:hypothetical protein HPB48_027101 [Haemaphysalis longicornis]|uniref:Uncharacterized protein n=1 Tax=Haemaphysalis longicornis TaxID=44386 RepID=A0A9J6HB42_HAELO|nr:hypothetical protein HPB48_027101 [Haemaphysalis longicornis]
MKKGTAKPTKRLKCNSDVDAGTFQRGNPSEGSLRDHNNTEALVPDFFVEVRARSRFSTDGGCQTFVDIVRIIEENKQTEPH